ncbi:hypothetical protein INT45_007974 [Circinella minor]|uniref:Vacuolar protein 14 C-terminal Fig4-binding domain-containing protein n=1 Tax=Circinella minor TaxID=1195481 RepID=A0A8H7S5Y3_9FUNG|nr:hypothetical protein INT45_007974 [Circinella minor]
MKTSVFSPTVIRELTDKTYDRRKVAALEVESLVKQNKESREQVIDIIQELVNDFVYSDSPHAQCGGLISLAATAIALGASVAEYLDIVVPPILLCLDRRGRLADDKEQSVRNGREILDRIIKDIVYELAATYVSPYHHHDVEENRQQEQEEKKAFSLSKFIPILRRHVYTSNPFERIYVMSWISLLDSVPGLDLVWYLPDFLDGIIRYLTDTRHHIRANARLLLAQFFQEIQFISRQNEDEGVAMLQKQRTNNNNKDVFNNETTLVSSTQDDQQNKKARTTGTPVKQLQYDRIVDILIQHISSTKEEIQRTALQWMIEFIAAAKPVVIQFTPRIVHAVLPLLEHSVPTISSFAMEINRHLQKLVLNYSSTTQTIVNPVPSLSDPSTTTTLSPEKGITKKVSSEKPTITMTTKTTGGPILLRRAYRSDIGHNIMRPKNGELFDYSLTVTNLKLQFLNEHEQTRLASLEWLLLLHKKAPNKVLASMDSILSDLLKTLSDPSEEVVYRDLELLAQIANDSDDDGFYIFVKKLLLLFEKDKRLLESRGSLIIRQLCIHLDVEKMYFTMATILLQKDQDTRFASMMVQNLNIIMITSSEMNCLRKQLRSLDTKHGQQLFLTLFQSWSHNAIAAFSLSLIAQAYELASNMLQVFAELDITVNMLIQLDQLVQLLESPAFTYLRLQLLEPDRYPYLFKCLYGIFMLLPQSSAFSTLRSRLNSASSLGFLHVMPKRTN